MTKEKEETTDVAIREDGAIIGADQFELNELMEGVEVQLPCIKIIHLGRMFEMPDGSMVQSFRGTIIDMHKTCAYWKISYDDSGGGDFPDCHSLNGVTPEGDNKVCQVCAKCPKTYMNVNKVDGKPTESYCKNNKRLHVVVEGSMLPHRLVLSVKNIKPVDIYVSLMAGIGAPYPLIETEFSLKMGTSSAGKEYSELVLKKVGTTPLVKVKEDVQKVKDLIAQWRNVMRGEVDFGDDEAY